MKKQKRNDRITFGKSKETFDFYGNKVHYDLVLLDGKEVYRIDPISCDDVIGQRNWYVESLERKIKNGEL